MLALALLGQVTVCVHDQSSSCHHDFNVAVVCVLQEIQKEAGSFSVLLLLFLFSIPLSSSFQRQGVYGRGGGSPGGGLHFHALPAAAGLQRACGPRPSRLRGPQPRARQRPWVCKCPLTPPSCLLPTDRLPVCPDGVAADRSVPSC